MSLAVAVMIVVPATAQTGSERDSYSTAVEFVQRAYPGLSGRDLTFTITSEGVAIDAAPVALQRFVFTVRSRAAVVLTGHFDFDNHGRFTRFLSGDDEIVNFARRRSVERSIGSLDPLTEVAAVEKLRAQNPTLGPAAAGEVKAAAVVLLERLRPLIGESEILGTKLSVLASVAWLVDVRAVSHREMSEFTIAMEPFGGMLIAMSRR